MDFRDKRLRTSILIEIDGKSFVIDTGPDFRQQMLREDVKRLDAVIFTHSHKDHTAGLDDVRAYNFIQMTDMPVYGEPHVLEQIKTEFYYAFEPTRYPGIPRLALLPIDHTPFEIEGIRFIPLPVLHMKMPVLGFRVGDFSYVTDANFISEQTFDKLKGTRVLVLNALQREKHLSHFNLEEAVSVAERVGAEKTWLIHVSHKLGLHREVEKELPTPIGLAYDSLQITV